ncbi:hypothetical protein C8J56DRAFT_1053746 [Mycena floridula]|nr:hypothetical protein C8J56DRAFT_1053746 [Mycena floridula]
MALNESTYRVSVLAFNILSFAGFFLLALVLIPVILSKQVHRNRTWFGVILAWMLYSLSYLLILGHQFGPEPPFGLCMFQTILIYTMPTMNGWTHLAFVTEVYLGIRMVLFQKKKRASHVRALVVIPYVMASASFFGAFVLMSNSADVQRSPSHMFCHSSTSGPATLTGTLSVIPLLVALPLEAWATYLVIRHWSTFRRVMKSNLESPVTLSILIRILVFTAVPITGISLTITSIASPYASVNETLWDVLLLTPACAFGTRRDVLYGWVLWWRRRKNNDDSEPESPVVTIDSAKHESEV